MRVRTGGTFNNKNPKQKFQKGLVGSPLFASGSNVVSLKYLVDNLATIMMMKLVDRGKLSASMMRWKLGGGGDWIWVDDEGGECCSLNFQFQQYLDEF